MTVYNMQYLNTIVQRRPLLDMRACFSIFDKRACVLAYLKCLKCLKYLKFIRTWQEI